MTILKNTLHEDDQTGTVKKMLSLSNAHLFNALVKLASQATGRSESEIIEECVEEKYLSCRQEMIKDSIKLRLEHGYFSIAGACCDIFCYYAAMHERTDDSLLELIRFLLRLEMKWPTEIEGDEVEIHHLLEQLDSVITYLKRYSEKTDDELSDSRDRCRYVKTDDISTLESLYMDIRDDPESVLSTRGVMYIFTTVLKYWSFSGSEDDVSFRNFSRVYRLLADICRLARWKETSREIVTFLEIARTISDSDPKDGCHEK